MKLSIYKCQRGQAMVEAALILPILIILMMGIVEFGRIGNTYLTVTNAARHGARLGAVGATDAQITDKVKSTAVSLNPAKLSVLVNRAVEEISITVSYPVKLMAPVVGGLVANPFPVSTTVIMRME